VTLIIRRCERSEAIWFNRPRDCFGAFHTPRSDGDCYSAALPGRAKQESDEPQRHDDQRAEQDVRHRPGEAAASQILDLVWREPGLADQQTDADAEMRQDGSDDQRRDRDLDQRPQEALQHPRLVVAAPSHLAGAAPSHLAGWFAIR
jgi:hypothetical protein